MPAIDFETTMRAKSVEFSEKYDLVQLYMNEVSRHKLLPREKEKELAARFREHNDTDAAGRLVTANLRLVIKIALDFQKNWMKNLADLIQEGNVGLVQAAKRFDPYKNVKFSYYASFWIKAYIFKFIMDNWSFVKIGTTQGRRKLFFNLKKEKRNLVEQGFDPTPKLLSEKLGVPEHEVIDMDQRLQRPDISLDIPLGDDDGKERIDDLRDEVDPIDETVADKEMKALLNQKADEFKKKLTPREIEIFEKRIFSSTPLTLQKMGDRYGISRERVRQIESRIITKFTKYFKQELPDFDSYHLN